MDDLDELYGEFISDTLELIEMAEEALLKITDGDRLTDHYDLIFRTFHNVKGSAGMMGLIDLQEIVHELETDFVALKGADTLSENDVQKFLKGLDQMKSFIEKLSGQESSEEVSHDKDVTSDKSNDNVEVENDTAEFWLMKLKSLCGHFVNQESFIKHEEAIEDCLDHLKLQFMITGDDNVGTTSEILQKCLNNIKTDIENNQKWILLFKKVIDSFKEEDMPISNVVSEKIDMPKEKIEPVIEEVVVKEAEGPKNTSSAQQSFVKITVAHLDKLMNLMGEMVLVRNQVLQHTKNKDDYEFLNLSQRLDIVTSELQEQVMQTRMQPIGNLLNRYKRIVHDISKELGKEINLKLSGVETELDRSLLEFIKDPLTHIVRNSCDHGIETTSERAKSGKSSEGTIHINAFHEGGQVVITVQDDGRGIDPQKMVEKAVEKGILSNKEAEQISEEEAVNLIFHPGFSTAQKVTNISGRGVGMDVVLSNLEKINGSIKVSSDPGKGLLIQVYVPLTLAIVPALSIRCHETPYVIPQLKLVELVRVVKAEEKYQIEVIQDRPVLTLRGQLLPLVSLREVLGLENRNDLNHNINQTEILNIVVVDSDSGKYGLIVDAIDETADIVVKPLHKSLTSLMLYSGVTVLGSGDISPILDIEGIGVLSKLNRFSGRKQNLESDSETNSLESESLDLLNFELGDSDTLTIPMGLVERLEDFNRNEISKSGDQYVIRYRESMLRLFDLRNFFKLESSFEQDVDTFQVIVVRYGSVQVGVVVDKILDVHKVYTSQIDDVFEDERFTGRAPADNKIYSVLDLNRIFEISGLGEVKNYEKMLKNKSYSVLYAEDISFFRKYIQKILDKMGIEVELAVDGEDALRIIQSRKETFDLVLTDIDMPKLNGFELAQKLRNMDAYKNKPIVALSANYNNEFISKGKKIGLNDYIEKVDEDLLKNTILTQLKGAA